MSLYKNFAGFDVMAWSISGNETCVAVRKGVFNIAFDLGFSPKEVVNCDTVFISHGHLDHVGCLPQHARKRQLLRLPPARYLVPLDMVEPLKEICVLFGKMHGEGAESLLSLDIVGVEPGQTIELNKHWYLEVFVTAHRIDSLGCVVFQRKRGLRPEYAERSGDEIRTLVQTGTDVHMVTASPEVAYLGDTAFSVFHPVPAHPSLLLVRLLITEMTYLDQPEQRLPLAHQYGHSHICELARHWELFRSVEKIILIHFSDRYGAGEIIRRVKEALPHQMRRSVYCATLAKDALTLAAQHL